MTNAPPRHAALANWLTAPIALLAIGVGISIVMRGPAWVAPATVAAILALSFLWIFISVFAHAKPDRTCPRCGEDSVERMNRSSTRGLVCTSCAWSDATASSFYLAEEEDDPIEPTVLAERAERAAPTKGLASR